MKRNGSIKRSYKEKRAREPKCTPSSSLSLFYRPVTRTFPTSSPVASGIKIRSTRIENKSSSNGVLARSVLSCCRIRRNSLIEFRRVRLYIPDDIYYFRRERKGRKGAAQEENHRMEEVVKEG